MAAFNGNVADVKESKAESKTLEQALLTAGLSHLLDKFLLEKVTVDLIPLLDNHQLISLGVTHIGQQVVLQNYCKMKKAQNEVNTETRTLFQSAVSSSSINSDLESSISRASKLLENIKSNPKSIERHSKKRKKGDSSRQFQKNLVVIDFQDTELPDDVCTLHDYDKIFDGLMTLNSSMTENDIRGVVVSLLRSKKTVLHTFDQLMEDDFQFVKCTNRRIRVPDGDPVCDADGIKSLYRSGSVYVRLTRSFSQLDHVTFPVQNLSSSGPSHVITTTTGVNISSIVVPTITSCITISPTTSVTIPVVPVPTTSEYATSSFDVSTHMSSHMSAPLPSDRPSYLDPQQEYIEILSDSSDDILIEDTNYQLVIEESLSSSLLPKSEFESVSELLKSHATKKCFPAEIPEERQRIIVRRKHIWNDAKRALRQPGFNDSIGLNIVFIGEDAHDAGGPCREFFRLVLKQMSEDGNLFGGQPSSRTLMHNVLALQSNEFHIAGHLIALSLMYGGPAPYFFSESLLSYLLNEPLNCGMVAEISDYHVQSALQKLLNATSTEEVQKLLKSEEFDFRFEAGVHIPFLSAKVEDKDKLVMAFINSYLLYSCKGEMDQLKDGLSHLGVLQLMRDHSLLMKPLFRSDGKQHLSSSALLDLFKILWSPEGANDREIEESIIYGWTNYVHECGSPGRVVGDVIISVESILAFITGADHIPPMGFENVPEIHFTGTPDKKEMRLPSASTCGPTLYLPLCLSDADVFAEKMDIAIVGAQSFGVP